MGNSLYLSYSIKASPGAAIFWQDMLFDILFLADWHKIGEYRQSLTDHSNQRKNDQRIGYDCKVGDKILIEKVYSAKQSPIMAKSHGLSQQFIWMELSGFNAGPKQKNLITGE